MYWNILSYSNIVCLGKECILFLFENAWNNRQVPENQKISKRWWIFIYLFIYMHLILLKEIIWDGLKTLWMQEHFTMRKCEQRENIGRKVRGSWKLMYEWIGNKNCSAWDNICLYARHWLKIISIPPETGTKRTKRRYKLTITGILQNYFLNIYLWSQWLGPIMLF